MVITVGIVTANIAVLAGPTPSPTPTPPKSLSDPLHCPLALPAAGGDNQRTALLFFCLDA